MDSLYSLDWTSFREYPGKLFFRRIATESAPTETILQSKSVSGICIESTAGRWTYKGMLATAC